VFAARARSLNRKAAAWRRVFNSFSKADPDKAAEWNRFLSNEVPADLESAMPKFDPVVPVATRVASGKVIQALARAIPELVGGSADLAPSTRTLIDGVASVSRGAFEGRNLHFGVREHAMCALMNGMALHGGFRVFGATFFVFADYCRPAIRLAALMKLPVIYVFTHDSFYVGEDGPTHEPVEHAASLRCMPGMTVIRPSDATETAAAWVAAMKHREGPVAILLTRQNLATIDRAKYPAASSLEKGAYVLAQTAPGKPGLIIIASGSEVQLALDAAAALKGEAVVRVVSMPSWELFERQPASYRNEVLPPECRTRLAVEAAVSFGWERYVGLEGRVIGLNRFGASAPFKVLAEKFGFTGANVTGVARAMIAGAKS
jgi:transketolase